MYRRLEECTVSIFWVSIKIKKYKNVFWEQVCPEGHASACANKQN
jgi:hypothetical protein